MEDEFCAWGSSGRLVGFLGVPVEVVEHLHEVCGFEGFHQWVWGLGGDEVEVYG